MTLVRTGAAFNANIEEYLQRAILAAQFIHFRDGLVFPVINQLTRKSQVFLEDILGNKRFAVRHDPRLDVGDDRIFF